MGCNGHCACGAAKEPNKEVARALPDTGVHLDAGGKCPCGKAASECCHKETLAKDENEAIQELCAAETRPCG